MGTCIGTALGAAVGTALGLADGAAILSLDIQHATHAASKSDWKALGGREGFIWAKMGRSLASLEISTVNSPLVAFISL